MLNGPTRGVKTVVYMVKLMCIGVVSALKNKQAF